jgi:hypothetical protein
MKRKGTKAVFQGEKVHKEVCIPNKKGVAEVHDDEHLLRTNL